ncbi:uncharacterized protein LOC112502542 [Cynara cardunculus var. scolymus]|uniref:uncharacterized protein LOC112502542 n=1 Tax=Cynara cardunculus var. scolymus TaxID=59895 RepID=UPI000D6293A7|nr:uncharacterized protein LOC112502542 [Cynara cardunculus var. scolymus]
MPRIWRGGGRGRGRGDSTGTPSPSTATLSRPTPTPSTATPSRPITSQPTPTPGSSSASVQAEMWSEIPKEVKTRMWERFQGYYCWDSALDAKMLQIWETRGAKNYNDGMNSARRRAGEMARSQSMPYVENDPNRDMTMLKGFHPKWLDPRIWCEMINRWNTPHWKGVVSKAAHDNRMTMVEGDIAKHTGRSITFTKTKNGVPPSARELFDHTHKKRSSTESSSGCGSRGEYVTSRCSQVAMDPLHLDNEKFFIDY